VEVQVVIPGTINLMVVPKMQILVPATILASTLVFKIKNLTK